MSSMNLVRKLVLGQYWGHVSDPHIDNSIRYRYDFLSGRLGCICILDLVGGLKLSFSLHTPSPGIFHNFGPDAPRYVSPSQGSMRHIADYLWLGWSSMLRREDLLPQRSLSSYPGWVNANPVIDASRDENNVILSAGILTVVWIVSAAYTTSMYTAALPVCSSIGPGVIGPVCIQLQAVVGLSHVNWILCTFNLFLLP